jgi:hypothetical protein
VLFCRYVTSISDDLCAFIFRIEDWRQDDTLKRWYPVCGTTRRHVPDGRILIGNQAALGIVTKNDGVPM